MAKYSPADNILNNTKEFLAEHGLSEGNAEVKDKLRELVIPALAASRNIQSTLYGWEPPHAKGVTRAYKNRLLAKIKNIVVNVLERTITRQQKYNELLYQAVVELAEENRSLKEKINSLK